MNALGQLDSDNRVDDEGAECGDLPWRAVALESEILEAFDRPIVGESMEIGYRRKERELMSTFAALSVLDAYELHRRLSVLVANDPIARRFQRLIVPRRERLLAFLRDARRRAAICGTPSITYSRAAGR